MTILAQPGVYPRDLISVQPVGYGPDPRGEDWGRTWQPKGRPLRAFSRKLTSSELHNTGKSDQVISYNVYVDLPRGFRTGSTMLPVNEKDRLWHPEGSGRNADGTPDYSTSMEIISVVPYPQEGVAQIDVTRTI